MPSQTFVLSRAKFRTTQPLLLWLLLTSSFVLSLGGCREREEQQHARSSSSSGTPPLSSTASPPNTSSNRSPASSIATYTYEVVNSWPHDRAAFTQGLIFHQGKLFESTGLNGLSSLRQVDLTTGRVLKKTNIPAEHFGEGITIFDSKIFVLTWQSRKGFIYDPISFQMIGEFTYEGEGWGLTHDGEHLIISDGTHRLRFLDPKTFRVVRTIEVYANNNMPLKDLNELEYIDGEIYANIWQTERIVRLDPGSGRILGWIDLSGLLSPADRHTNIDVLNGIAYDRENNRLFVTGKLWPKLFEIRLRKR